MALVKKIDPLMMERNEVHEEVDCTYSVFENAAGVKYLQIDTYGSKHRKIKDKKSQSVQFNHESIVELKKIIEL